MTDDAPLVVVLLVAALVVAPVAASAAGGSGATAGTQHRYAGAYGAQDGETSTPRAEGNTSIQPGEKLTGVVAVQQAELEGEVDERAFGVTVARSKHDESTARIVAEQFEGVEERVDELERRARHLRAARENESISEGRYRAEMAAVAAELETARRLTNASVATARGLPSDLLAANGVDAGAVRSLVDRTGALSGPEVAENARSIAGRDVGRSMDGERPHPAGHEPGVEGVTNGSTGLPDSSDGGSPGLGIGGNDTDVGGNETVVTDDENDSIVGDGNDTVVTDDGNESVIGDGDNDSDAGL